MKILSV